MPDIKIKSQVPVGSNNELPDLPDIPDSPQKEDIETIEEKIELMRKQISENEEAQARLKEDIKKAIQNLKDTLKKGYYFYSPDALQYTADLTAYINQVTQKLANGENLNVGELRNWINRTKNLSLSSTGNLVIAQIFDNALEGLVAKGNQQTDLVNKANDLQNNIYNSSKQICQLEVDYYTAELQKLGIPIPKDITSDVVSVKRLRDMLAKAKIENASPNLNEPDNVIDIIIMAEILRVQQFDTQLSMISNEMQDRNNYMKEINDMLNKARVNRPADDDHPAPLPTEVIVFMKAHGLDAPGVGEKLKPAKYDQYILSIKGLLDDNNNESQLQMVKLQRVISYRNQCFEFASNTISKIVRSKDIVIGNIRG